MDMGVHKSWCQMIGRIINDGALWFLIEDGPKGSIIFYFQIGLGHFSVF